MTDRYISAGFWMDVQDALMKIAPALGILGITVVPAVVLYSASSAALAYGAMGVCVIAMIYLVLLSLVLEPVRMNGLPIIEK